MASMKEMERRLEVAETTVQTMFCTVTADLMMVQSAVIALREEGVLTLQIVDRMANDARARLKEHDNRTLSPQMITRIANQLDSLTERLRAAVPPKPLASPANGGKSDGNGSGNGRRKR